MVKPNQNNGTPIIKRMNLSFDLSKPEEKQVYEFIESFPKSKKQVVIEMYKVLMQDEDLIGKVTKSFSKEFSIEEQIAKHIKNNINIDAIAGVIFKKILSEVSIPVNMPNSTEEDKKDNIEIKKDNKVEDGNKKSEQEIIKKKRSRRNFIQSTLNS